MALKKLLWRNVYLYIYIYKNGDDGDGTMVSEIFEEKQSFSVFYTS